MDYNNSSIMIVDLFALVISSFAVFYHLFSLLAQLRYIKGFDDAKETYAKILYWEHTSELDEDVHVRITYSFPVLGFHNDFTNQYEEKVDYRANIMPKSEARFEFEKKHAVETGEELKIQYTPKKIRIVDERYIAPNEYDLYHCAKPLIISSILWLISAIILVVLILSQK